jgi:hypothetical protein
MGTAVMIARIVPLLVLVLSSGAALARSESSPSKRTVALQVAARGKLSLQRAMTLPAHLWPFNKIATLISHGEPLAGLRSKDAVRAAKVIYAHNGTGTVIGRLAWELHDIWSVRGAKRSYLRLVDQLAVEKQRHPALDVAVSIDAESLGVQLDGIYEAQRRRVAIDGALEIARAAKQKGIPVEFDMGTSDAMPFIVEAARTVATQLRYPVRLAIAARYDGSREVLTAWADLARQQGLRLGVRLVKGSFIEADQPEATNTRRELLDKYKALISQAMARHEVLDIGVASQNDEIWEHANDESARLGADFKMHVIHGVNMPLQMKMRAAGKIAREYVSYGMDAPVMGVMELYTNWKAKRTIERRGERRTVD